MGYGRYLDVLDTVKVNNSFIGADERNYNYFLADTEFKKRVIFDPLPPILSQSQAFDSLPFITALSKGNEMECIKELILKRKINIALYDVDSLINAFKNALLSGIENGKDMFVFSGIHELEKGTKKEIIDKRRECIEILETGKSATSFEDKNFIENVIQGIRNINEEVSRSNQVASKSSYELGKLIDTFLKNQITEDFNEYTDVYSLLNEIYKSAIEDNKQNDRTYYYSYIKDKLDKDSNSVKIVINIIDYYYNAIIGSSVTSNNNNMLLTSNIKAFSTSLNKKVESPLDLDINNNDLAIVKDERIKKISWEDILKITLNTNSPSHSKSIEERNNEILNYCSKNLKNRILKTSSGIALAGSIVGNIAMTFLEEQSDLATGIALLTTVAPYLDNKSLPHDINLIFAFRGIDTDIKKSN